MSCLLSTQLLFRTVIVMLFSAAFLIRVLAMSSFRLKSSQYLWRYGQKYGSWRSFEARIEGVRSRNHPREINRYQVRRRAPPAPMLRIGKYTSVSSANIRTSEKSPASFFLSSHKSDHFWNLITPFYLWFRAHHREAHFLDTAVYVSHIPLRFVSEQIGMVYFSRIYVEYSSITAC